MISTKRTPSICVLHNLNIGTHLEGYSLVMRKQGITDKENLDFTLVKIGMSYKLKLTNSHFLHDRGSCTTNNDMLSIL